MRVLALKKAEQGDEVIVRLVEMDGKPAQNVSVAFAAPIVAAREVNGAEEPVGPATVTKGELVTELHAVPAPHLRGEAGRAPARRWRRRSRKPVTLPYRPGGGQPDDTGRRRLGQTGALLCRRRCCPARSPSPVSSSTSLPLRPGNPTPWSRRGQTIPLPAGKFTRLYLLAAADGDQKATFRIGDTPVELTIQDWGGYIGQWDNRIWNTPRKRPCRRGQDAPAQSVQRCGP